MIKNEKIHVSSIITSLDKAYNQSKLNGKLPSEDIYLLDVVYKLLSECELSLTNDQIRFLKDLYFSISNNSKYICKAKLLKSYYVETVTPFVQAESTDCNNIPTQDLIYYWQESLGITSDQIVNLIATSNYLEDKPSDLKINFIEGKDIDYTNIGLICFALNKTESATKYVIYDDNEADVTDGFESFYNNSLKTRIFISYNIYSHGIMNFKIKKI